MADIIVVQEFAQPQLEGASLFLNEDLEIDAARSELEWQEHQLYINKLQVMKARIALKLKRRALKIAQLQMQQKLEEIQYDQTGMRISNAREDF